MTTRTLAAIALLLAHLAPLKAEDVEAPLYTNWSRFPIGTSVTMKATVTQLGQTTITTTRTKLVSKSDKNIVISTVISSDGTGSLVTNDPIEKSINRLFPLLPGVDKTRIGRPQGSTAQGMETIQVLGKPYQAEWYETKGTTEAGPSLSRTWISMDVPNMLLKSQTEVKAADKIVKIELVEISLGQAK